MSAIAVTALRKEYRTRTGVVMAVDGLDLQVEPGEVYALLGHNGAGKTTAIEILEGHRTRSSGEVQVLGEDPSRGNRAWRDRIGVVLQTSGVEPELTVREVLALAAGCYRQPRPVPEVIEMIGLTEATDTRVGALSGGQARRVALGLGVIGRPELLFLDEPTTGFDPTARRSFWDLISSLGAQGTTVLLTTHYLDEAEHLADRVGVMAAGRMIAEGTPAELIGTVGGSTVSFTLPGAPQGAPADALDAPERAVEELAAVVAGRVTHTGGGRIEIATGVPTADLAAVTAWAVAHGVELPDLAVTRSTLEDVFLRLGEQQ